MNVGAVRLERLVKAVLLLVVLANAGRPLLSPVSAADFFWHLKTGEWIVEHRALPDRFLFVSTPPDTPAVMQRFTTTSYWMTQVLYWGAHAVAGLAGIVAIRFLLFALLLLALYLRKGDGDDLVFLGLLAPAVVILAKFPMDRPQQVSFVFFAVLLVLLAGLRVAPSRAALLRRAAAIPLLMLVWANCHGGYVVGLAILGLWLIAESLKLLHPALGPLPPERYRVLLAAGAAGALVSFLNPNTWHVFEVALLPNWQASVLQEYRSTVEIYRFYAEPWVLLYWGLLAVTVAGLALSWRRADLTELALVAVTGYFSFTTLRHIPFFLVAAVPICCRLLSAPRVVRWARVACAAAGIAVGILYAGDAAAAYRRARNCATVNAYQFPVQAADFISATGLAGNLFNHYSWGGYLLWRLAPREVFIDSRNSDRTLQQTYDMIVAGRADLDHGVPFWKRQFQARGIHFTVTPFFDELSGLFLDLVDRLAGDPAWVPVHATPTSIIFVEDVPENREVIRRYALTKEQLLRQLLQYSAALAAAAPSFPEYSVAQGEVLLRLGDRAGALRCYERALRIAPGQPVARDRVAMLRAAAP